jgi:hypothetical protein
MFKLPQSNTYSRTDFGGGTAAISIDVAAANMRAVNSKRFTMWAMLSLPADGCQAALHTISLQDFYLRLRSSSV